MNREFVKESSHPAYVVYFVCPGDFRFKAFPPINGVVGPEHGEPKEYRCAEATILYHFGAGEFWAEVTIHAWDEENNRAVEFDFDSHNLDADPDFRDFLKALVEENDPRE